MSDHGAMGVSDYTAEMDRLRLKVAYLTNVLVATKEKIAQYCYQSAWAMSDEALREIQKPDGEWKKPKNPYAKARRKASQPSLS